MFYTTHDTDLLSKLLRAGFSITSTHGQTIKSYQTCALHKCFRHWYCCVYRVEEGDPCQRVTKGEESEWRYLGVWGKRGRTEGWGKGLRRMYA